MLKSRQRRSLVRSYSVTHPSGQVVLPTEPGWDRILLAAAGLVTAQTEVGSWAVPAHRALCVPDGSILRIETIRRTPIRCLYARTELKLLDDRVRVVNLTPLTQELIRYAVSKAPMSLDESADKALMSLLADRVADLPEAPLQLPLPRDPSARALASAILADPGVGLAGQLRLVPASRRTLERRFKVQTRLSLGQWYRRARVLSAVAMLADGDSVSSVALRVGYASPSSFIAAFRSELGSPPGEFMGNPMTMSAGHDGRHTVPSGQNSS